MKLRNSTLEDIPRIMEIIKDAQEYLASLNIDQWQDGYPDYEQIKLDIKNNDSYVILSETNQIMGTTVYTTTPESTYKNIDGKWLTEDDSSYGVIHRLAVGEEYRKLGLAEFVFTKFEQKVKDSAQTSMRIDTHRDNKGMQYMLKKRGHEYCGVILLDDGDERLAFEKRFN
jgi:ribosomal protein S18 acetylase RimI-like enzyme